MHKGFRFAPLLLLAALLGCGGGTGGGGSSGIPPQITSFGATPNTITAAGQAVVLAWSVSGEDTLQITDSAGTTVTVSGTSYTVNPAQSTVYRLTATNDFGSNYSDTTVTLAGDTSEPPTPPSPPPPPDDPAPPGNPNPPGNPSPPTPPAPPAPPAPPGNPPGNPPATAPTITSFTVNGQPSVEVEPETEVTLAWEVTGKFTEITITPGVGTVTAAKSSTKVKPTQNTTYTINAKNGNAAAQSKTVTVTIKGGTEPQPGDAPKIDSLTASKDEVLAGEAFSLLWEISGGAPTTVTLEWPGQAPINVTGKESHEVTAGVPNTTTFTLKAQNAQNANSPVQATTTVKVSPRIEAFSVSPVEAIKGETVTVSWDVSGPSSTSVLLSWTGQTPIQVAQQGSRPVPVSKTTTFDLEAHNGDVSVKDSKEVVVAPDIVSFTATPEYPGPDEQVRLSWSIEGGPATEVTLSGSGIRGELNVTGKSSYIVKPGYYGYFYLTASNSAGSDDEDVYIYDPGY